MRTITTRTKAEYLETVGEFACGLAWEYGLLPEQGRDVWRKLRQAIYLEDGQPEEFLSQIEATGERGGRLVGRLLIECNRDGKEYVPEIVCRFAHLPGYQD